MEEEFIGSQVSIMSSDGCTSSIEVNGVDVSKASEIIYRHKAGEPPELTIKFHTGEMQLNSVCRVKVENGGHDLPCPQPDELDKILKMEKDCPQEG